MNNDLTQLRERVRAAEGPDREIDAAITVALQVGVINNRPDDHEYLRNPNNKYDDCAPGTYWLVSRSGMSLRTSEPLTASIDSALTLVERTLPSSTGYEPSGRAAGWRIEIERGPFPDMWFCALRQHARDGYDASAEIAPLAILDALLTALIEKEG